jgi:hypothetical protein
MANPFVTAADLEVFTEEEIKTNWSWVNFRDPKDVSQFQVNHQRIVHWSTALNTEWCPTIIQKAAMGWLISKQPAITNLVLEWLTSRGYRYAADNASGKEERANRVVEIWKVIATKYRGVLDG